MSQSQFEEELSKLPLKEQAAKLDRFFANMMGETEGSAAEVFYASLRIKLADIVKIWKI